MAIRTTALGLTIIITAAVASACAGASDSGNKTGDLMGAGGGGGEGTGFGAGGNGFAGAGFGGSLVQGGGGAQVGGGGFQAAGGGTPFGNGGALVGAGGALIGAGGEGAGGGAAGGGGTGPAPTADSASKQGTCKVASYTQGVPAGADYVNPTVYYPTDCPAPFPGVVVIPGFTEVQGQINQWGTFLASHGFAVMMVDTAAGGVANTGVQPPARATGLMQAVPNLKAENSRAGSPLMGKLNPDLIAIMGHSMGGGGTMLAANTHPELKAAIGLCPWNPGVTYPQNKVPSLFFDGTADFLVSPAAATAEYQSIPATTHKTYVEFNEGSHFVANTPLGAAASDKIVARIGLSWLEVYVVGDTRYAPFIAKDPSMSAFDVKP